MTLGTVFPIQTSWLVNNIHLLYNYNLRSSGFSLTFEVEGHWLVSRQVPCETEGRGPETVGGSGGMLPRKIFRT